MLLKICSMLQTVTKSKVLGTECKPNLKLGTSSLNNTQFCAGTRVSNADTDVFLAPLPPPTAMACVSLLSFLVYYTTEFSLVG